MEYTAAFNNQAADTDTVQCGSPEGLLTTTYHNTTDLILTSSF